MGHAMEVLTSRGGSWSGSSPGGMATTQSNFAQPSGGTVQSQQTPADVAGRYDPRMVKIVVEAPPEVASRLARIIESEGLQVSYSPPMETRSIESEVVARSSIRCRQTPRQESRAERHTLLLLAQ